jgi:hypothetical protein
MDSYYEQGDIFPIERKSAVLPSGVVVEMVEFEEDFLVRAYEVDADGVETKVEASIRLGTIGGAETMFDSYCQRY